MTTYLVVKTGRKGQTVSELYSAGLTGDCRLLGGWYRQITGACKRLGVTGTLSVYKYTDDARAEELLAEWQRSFLQLKDNISWSPVAVVRIAEEQLSAVSKEVYRRITDRGIGLDRLYYDGAILKVRMPDRVLQLKEEYGLYNRSYIAAHNACIKDYKVWRKEQEALLGEELLQDYIRLV